MSDTSAFGFGQFVPGFDFLQNLSKTAAQAQPAAAGVMPGMTSWVAPTLSIEEIDKRIQELKSVQFWLEQNATALKATIQAMEVQKMTLSTLQSMNVNMADLAKAFTAKPPEAKASASFTAAAAQETPAAARPSLFTPKPTPASVPPQSVPSEPEASASPQQEAQAEPADTQAVKPVVDPMQWWGALTQQFQGIAAAALKDVAAEAMKSGMSAKNAKGPASGSARAKTATSKPRTAKGASLPKSPAKSAVKRVTPARSSQPSAAPRKTAKK